MIGPIEFCVLDGKRRRVNKCCKRWVNLWFVRRAADFFFQIIINSKINTSLIVFTLSSWILCRRTIVININFCCNYTNQTHNEFNIICIIANRKFSKTIDFLYCKNIIFGINVLSFMTPHYRRNANDDNINACIHIIKIDNEYCSLVLIILILLLFVYFYVRFSNEYLYT